DVPSPDVPSPDVPSTGVPSFGIASPAVTSEPAASSPPSPKPTATLQTPALQASPTLQRRPHAPQLFGSRRRSTHLRLHSERPSRQSPPTSVSLPQATARSATTRPTAASHQERQLLVLIGPRLLSWVRWASPVRPAEHRCAP